MRSFSTFLSEAFNIPIRDESDVNSFETKQDKEGLKKLVKHLNLLGLDDIPIAGGSGNKIKIRSAQDKAPEIKQWIKDNAPDLTGVGFGQGSLGKDGVKISETTQEMMVAALVLNKVRGGTVSESEAVDMIENAKKVFNDIDGATARPELVDQFNGNFNDLATAISSSDAILKVCPNPVKVYWTGKGWTGEIAKYNPPIGNVKDYNSSDIVVKNSDGVFHGFSLKKKGRSTDVDPTLINKPITGNVGILKDILGAKDVELIERSKQLFFDYVIFKHYKENPKRIDPKVKKKMIGDITQKQMGVYLKDPKNTFFRRVFQILSKHSEDFTKTFIELLFRTKMKDIEDSGEFKFYLLTGIGRFVKGSVEVEKAELKDTPQTIATLTRIFNSNLVMKPTPGKKQAWEKDAGAAKVFFSIFSDGAKIIDLEIRYKGSYTANPQFQAVATPDFKKIFKEDVQIKPHLPMLTEGKEGKNLHLEHIEDEILNFGVPGGRAAINFVRSLRDMLAGESRSSVNMTVKWDGAPAIFAGEDPSDGKFFVAKKSVFNEKPLLYKSVKEIQDATELSGTLKSKFTTSFTEFSKLGIKGVLQGDLMFTSEDKGKDKIDGKSFITFQPNTIVYAVDPTSDIGRSINSAKIGVVWHTTYKGSTLQDMKASFGANISGLTKSKTVWMDDATYKDVSGKATMTSKETDEVTTHLSNCGKTFQRINAPLLKKFLRLQDSLTGKLAGASYKTYNNTKVRAGQAVTDPKGHANGYITHVENHFQKEIEKLKTQKSKDVLETKKIEYVREFKKMLPNLQQVTAFQMHLVNAKMGIVKKLNSVKGLTDTFIKTSNGFKVVNPEGYVAIDRVSGDAVKLVDRMEFSFNNFTAIKAWDK